MMLDLIPTPAPALTSHLRAHLLAQYRADMRHDRAELANLSRMALADMRQDKRRTHRIGALHLRLQATQEAIDEVMGSVR
mgnify:FL=1